MRYEIRIQDPTQPPQSLLFDVIIDLARRATVARGRFFFGFLTGSGMDALLAVPEVGDTLCKAEIEFLVGLDAVTDRAGLRRLAEVSKLNPKFRVRVIKNTTGALVHPKLLVLEYENGSGVAVVGSNNVSAGGLAGNVEGYSILYWDVGESIDLSDWDRFVDRWDPLLSPIDNDALDRAERNERRLHRVGAAVRRQIRLTPSGAEVVVSDGQAHETAPVFHKHIGELMLVAQIPRAGNRWSQVHYSADVARKFFQVEPGQQVVLNLRQLGTHDAEERPIVYSASSNMNVKMELTGAREASRIHGYPTDGRPIVLFRTESEANHRYRYFLLMPGDPGHDEMTTLAVRGFHGPANQVARVIVDRSTVLAAWPGCPL